MRNELKIGWVLLIALVILFGFLSWLRKASFSAQEKYQYIWFEDVSGLQEGDPVTVSGRNSGYVRFFNQPGGDSSGWIITVSLNPEIKLYSDVSAVLKVKEITGGRVVDIIPGISGRPSLSPVIRGKAGWDAGTLLSEIKPLIQSLQDSSFQHLLLEAGQTLHFINSAETRNIIPLLQNTLETSSVLLRQAQILTHISPGEPGIAQTLLEVQRTLGTVQGILDTLKPVLNAETFQKLGTLGNKTDSVLQLTHQVLYQTQGLLQHIEQDTASLLYSVSRDSSFNTSVKNTLNDLRRVIKQIEDGKFKARVRF